MRIPAKKIKKGEEKEGFKKIADALREYAKEVEGFHELSQNKKIETVAEFGKDMNKLALILADWIHND